jgi:hypothetical protein
MTIILFVGQTDPLKSCINITDWLADELHKQDADE